MKLAARERERDGETGRKSAGKGGGLGLISIPCHFLSSTPCRCRYLFQDTDVVRFPLNPIELQRRKRVNHKNHFGLNFRECKFNALCLTKGYRVKVQYTNRGGLNVMGDIRGFFDNLSCSLLQYSCLASIH